MKILSLNRRGGERGFSLIEVTIAMAIAAVALVTLLGLIPQGMNTMREAGDQAIQGRIHQQLLNEIQMTPFEDANKKSLIDVYHEMEFYYDGQGEELSDSRDQNSVPEERREGSFAHIYSARITLPSGGEGTSRKAPGSVGGAKFEGYSFEVGGEPNQFVRPVIVEVAAVSGLGKDFGWDLPENRHLISTYQSIVVKMGQDYR
jgi:prepilin-type N-terminal cleavage/methylation domain-containing protein